MKVIHYYCTLRTLLFMAIVLYFTSFAWAAPDALPGVERAMSLLENGNSEAARTVLQEMTGDTGAQPLVVAMRAVIDFTQQNYPRAEAGFQHSLASDPHQMTALWGLALCLVQREAFAEAGTVLDRAIQQYPAVPYFFTLRAYVAFHLGQSDAAAVAAKTAFSAGDRSPLLCCVLAHLNAGQQHIAGAIDFAAHAATTFDTHNFLVRGDRLYLPCTPPSTGLPATVAALPEFILPTPVRSTPDAGTLQILSPRPGSTLPGVEALHISYSGAREIAYIAVMIDETLSAVLTEMPYRLTWDAGALDAGTHNLVARAFDRHGGIIDTAQVTVTVVLPSLATAQAGRQQYREAIERRMIEAIIPLPSPSSLFAALGQWYDTAGDRARAIAAYEKVAAFDPASDAALDHLARLYRAYGLHSVSASGEVYHGPAHATKCVALTFDDGPNPLYTPTILAELKRFNARGTFFLVGRMALQYPALVHDIVSQGHEIANHTYTHPNLTKITQRDVIAEVLRTRSVLKELTGQSTYLFRPPGGNIDPAVTRQLRALDYNIIYWDVNAGEFTAFTPEEQTARMLARVEDGSILLLHNGPIDGTLNILTRLLTALTSRGYSCVTVSELMKP